MMMEKHSRRGEPLLSFEFASQTGEIIPRTFRNPEEVIVAKTIDEVIPCLQQVQKAVEKGFYAAGYLSYESAPAFDTAYRVKVGWKMPLLWFGIYAEYEEESIQSNSPYHHSPWTPTVPVEEYKEAIKSIQQLIEEGETYQTNYTIRLTSEFQGDDIAYFEKLRSAQASNYCAYIHTGDYSILSASPELFFHLKDRQMTTRPMKGTIKRGKTYVEDEANRDWLYQSEKNRAENVMIVDLLRNDLGMIAEAGTVKVPKLFSVEQYPTVHQMTSTITAEISDHINLIDIFKALFPCGSITGAPKIRTMEIISEVETSPREGYCGAIGFITPEKEAIFNVPIRTVIIDNETGTATYGVGGGIAWDSTPEGEYEEVLAKASLLTKERDDFQLLESLLLEEGRYFLLDEHLMRLQNSARYFAIPFSINEMKESLFVLAEKYGRGKLKVRLLLSKSGEWTTECQPLAPFSPKMSVSLADEPIDKENIFFYHKTTNRGIYADFQKRFPDVFDVMLWNRDGEVTEFTNGNVVLQMEDGLWTPPVKSGLLAGTFRERLLAEGKIKEKTILVTDLDKASTIWFINSVRRWIQVELT